MRGTSRTTDARDASADGFSLIEVVIAMFILALIAIALLPALLSGIRFSSEQSTVATATRHLNGLIEEARDNANCERVDGPTPRVPNVGAFTHADPVATGVSFTDGKGSTLTVVAESINMATGVAGPYTCTNGQLQTLRWTAIDASGDPVATVTAQIFMGG